MTPILVPVCDPLKSLDATGADSVQAVAKRRQISASGDPASAGEPMGCFGFSRNHPERMAEGAYLGRSVYPWL